jgi:phosphate transport system substrate-binding protein
MFCKGLLRRSFLAGSAGSLLSYARPVRASDIAVAGGGSSFSRPVVQRWIDAMPKTPGMDVTYTVMGTGTAQTRVLSGDIDFAVIELPLSDSQLDTSQLLQFPVAFGALAFVVSIPGVTANRLRLDGVLLAEIYGGKIKNWNDRKIAALNPDLKLPDLAIHPLRLDVPDRSAFSTTTTVTQYLLATNPEWRAKFGDSIGKQRWAVGSMAATAAALAETVKVLPGSIGYVALDVALAGKFTTVQLLSRSGEPVACGIESLKAAVAAVDWAKTPRLVANLVDLPGRGVWPLVLPSYVVVPQAPRDKARAAALGAFLKYTIGDGATVTAASSAISVPPAVAERITALIAKVPS